MPYHNLMSVEEELHGRKQNFFRDGTVALLEESGEKSWYLQDELGSVQHLVDKEGKSRKAYVYDEFGMEQSGHNEESEIFQPFGYTGYQWESVPGQYYAQARSYDAGMGRFLSEDLKEGEKENPYTLNKYNYCWNRPLDMVDLDGRWPTEAGNGISNMLVGAARYESTLSISDLTRRTGQTVSVESGNATAGVASEFQKALSKETIG